MQIEAATNEEKAKKPSVLDKKNGPRETISEKSVIGEKLSDLKDTEAVVSPRAEHLKLKASRKLGRRRKNSEKKPSIKLDLEPKGGLLSNVGTQIGLKRSKKKKPRTRKQSKNVARRSEKTVTETGRQKRSECKCDLKSESCQNIAGVCKDKVKLKNNPKRTRNSGRRREPLTYEWVNCSKIFDVIRPSVPHPDNEGINKEECLTKCADHTNKCLASKQHNWHCRLFAKECYHCCTSDKELALIRSRPTNSETAANDKAVQTTTPTRLGDAVEENHEWTDNEYDICLKRCAALSNECHKYHGKQILPQVCRDSALDCEKTCKPPEN
ncbi:hypothetical protein CRM22_002286 [Opisthorchis felineus]|uniref:Uncharacterized protein n=1 Tax=Opisthorchis felineus TaxID=147828 RepID=A0A4S2M6R9_OPIFE|nr:hypothetical protein CRM22_002286 [Opisthorchis felineus]